VLVFSVCNTEINEVGVEFISHVLTCARASTLLRKGIGSKALFQVGVPISLRVLTQRKKEPALVYLDAYKNRIVAFFLELASCLAKRVTRAQG